jgi:WD40 repeat protein
MSSFRASRPDGAQRTTSGRGRGRGANAAGRSRGMPGLGALINKVRQPATPVPSSNISHAPLSPLQYQSSRAPGAVAADDNRPSALALPSLDEVQGPTRGVGFSPSNASDQGSYASLDDHGSQQNALESQSQSRSQSQAGSRATAGFSLGSLVSAVKGKQQSSNSYSPMADPSYQSQSQSQSQPQRHHRSHDWPDPDHQDVQHQHHLQPQQQPSPRSNVKLQQVMAAVRRVPASNTSSSVVQQPALYSNNNVQPQSKPKPTPNRRRYADAADDDDNSYYGKNGKADMRSRAGSGLSCWENFQFCMAEIGNVFAKPINAMLGTEYQFVTLEQYQLLWHELSKGVIVPNEMRYIDEESLQQTLSTFPPESILQVTVRKTDELMPDIRIIHPLVRLHIVDLRTGKPMRKSDANRAVVAPNEVGSRSHYQKNVAHILAMQTQLYSLRGKGSFIPRWEEDLIFNESMEHLLSSPYTLLLFELLDFSPKLDPVQFPDGYQHVAWAFLKLQSVKGKPNVGPLRLQLYRHVENVPRMADSTVPSIYYEWLYQRNTKRVRYPSSVWIHISGVAPLESRVVKAERPQHATDQEVGRISYEQMARVLLDEPEYESKHDKKLRGELQQSMDGLSWHQRHALMRKRKPDDACEIPSKQLHQLSCGIHGAFAVRFSPSGRYIAAACGEHITFSIKLYDTQTGMDMLTFAGHHELIYDLCWSSDGRELISASADQTVKVWNIRARNTEPVLSLPHTSYVYTAQFHPTARDPPLIYTGSFDGSIRIWNRETGRQLAQFNSHAPHNVNALVFAPNGRRFFTADSRGNIKVWSDSTQPGLDDTGRPSGRASSVGAGRGWSSKIECIRTITHPELKGDTINCLRFHANPEQLVAYCRDNALYLFSLRSYDLRHKFIGATCQLQNLRCAISPDGRLLVAGSENGTAHFWQTRTGKHVYTLDLGLGSQQPIHDVTWHPTEHAVAFAAFGSDRPITVYEHLNAII